MTAGQIACAIVLPIVGAVIIDNTIMGYRYFGRNSFDEGFGSGFCNVARYTLGEMAWRDRPLTTLLLGLPRMLGSELGYSIGYLHKWIKSDPSKNIWITDNHNFSEGEFGSDWDSQIIENF